MEIKAGVPQGSMLGSLLFISYINGIVRDIQSCIRLFADDMTFYVMVDLPNSTARILNNDLGRIFTSDLWQVRFISVKTESFLSARKRKKIHHPNLCPANVLIKEVSTHKHLGMHLRNSCDWQAHIEYMKDKASSPSRSYFLRSLKFTI